MLARLVLLLAPVAVGGFSASYGVQRAGVGTHLGFRSPSWATKIDAPPSKLPVGHARYSPARTRSQQYSRLNMVEVEAVGEVQESSTAAGLGCWIPVGSVKAFKDITPHMVKILNRNHVVWQNPQTGKWSVQVDACPHRLAPLSQGRVDEASGCIECPYHGWQFDSSGACTEIPQGDAASVPADKAAVQTLPTHLTGDLLWAFFPSSQTGESFPADLLPEDMYPVLKSATGEESYFIRELPYSWDFLVENFMDPGHIPFAHHSLQGVRSDGSPIAMEVVANNFTHCEVSFKDTIRGKPRDGVVSFQRPVYYHFRTTEGSDSHEYKDRLKIFTVPVAHGRCRVLFEAPRIGNLPTWLSHAGGNRFLNTDSWLHNAERTLRDPASDRLYFNPTSSDLGSVAFRKWWSKQGMEAAPPHSFGPAPFSDLPEQTRAEQINVWESHTKHCSECRLAAKRFKLAQRVAVVATVWAVALLASSKLLALAAGTVGLLLTALAGKCRRIVEGEVWPSGIADRSVAAMAEEKKSR